MPTAGRSTSRPTRCWFLSAVPLLSPTFPRRWALLRHDLLGCIWRRERRLGKERDPLVHEPALHREKKLRRYRQSPDVFLSMEHAIAALLSLEQSPFVGRADERTALLHLLDQAH